MTSAGHWSYVELCCYESSILATVFDKHGEVAIRLGEFNCDLSLESEIQVVHHMICELLDQFSMQVLVVVAASEHFISAIIKRSLKHFKREVAEDGSAGRFFHSRILGTACVHYIRRAASSHRLARALWCFQ